MRGFYREHRVLYQADAVGAYNILRKYIAISGKHEQLSVSGLCNIRSHKSSCVIHKDSSGGVSITPLKLQGKALQPDIRQFNYRVVHIMVSIYLCYVFTIWRRMKFFMQIFRK